MHAEPTLPAPPVVSRRRLLRTGLTWALGAATPATMALCALAPCTAAARGAGGAPSPVLAQTWRTGADPAGWLVSEKLDGVRALWDGRRMFFRSGRELAVPAAFRERLPDEALDGELWLGRGRFDALSGLLRRDEIDPAAWREVQYHLFELPGGAGPFARRAEHLRRLAAMAAWPGLQAAPQQPVADAVALQRRLAQVVAAGGEGLMLHRADAPWIGGRTPWLCKHKPLQDAEAVVVGYRPGQGRHAGRMGALKVQDDDGRRFAIGTGFSDAQRETPPALGARVTYSHQGVTEKGVPRFARFVREAAPF